MRALKMVGLSVTSEMESVFWSLKIGFTIVVQGSYFNLFLDYECSFMLLTLLIY